MAVHMLTTDDNPYDPFTEWDQWYMYDETSGHHTTGLLARVVKISDDLSEADQSQAIEDAIDEIVEVNASGLHLKVTRDVVLG